MCTSNDNEGERRSKRATRWWYDTQVRDLGPEGGEGGPWRGPSGWQGPSGWHPRSVGARLLLGGHGLRWLRWVLLDLDQHAPDCRWRALLLADDRR